MNEKVFLLEKEIKDALDKEKDKGYRTRMQWMEHGIMAVEIWWRDDGEGVEIAVQDFIKQEKENDRQKTKEWAERVVGELENCLNQRLGFREEWIGGIGHEGYHP